MTEVTGSGEDRRPGPGRGAPARYYDGDAATGFSRGKTNGASLGKDAPSGSRGPWFDPDGDPCRPVG